MNLSKVFTAIAFTIASGTVLMAQSGPTPVLSLEQCIGIALSKSPTIKVADMEVTRVDYSRKETLGQLLPSISFGATYNRTLAKQVMYMNMDGFGDMGNKDESEPSSRAGSDSKSSGGGIKVGLDNSYNAGFSASMPLVAPQLWQSMKLADSQILRSVEQARSSRLELVNQVKSAYYTLLLAEDSRRVINESYEMAKLNFDIYTKKHEAGAASDYDVLRTSVAMKNIEPELMQSEIAIKQARLQLLILMGLDADFSFTTESGLSAYEETMYESALNQSRDYSRNPSLVLNQIDSSIARRNVNIQKAAWFPTLALSANYNWTSMSNGSPLRNFRWTPYTTIGLTRSFPIFAGGQRYSRVKQAKLQAAELLVQREDLRRNIDSQVTLAIDNINVNIKQIASCSESVKEAERAHDIMQRSFEIGAASYLDLRDSELSLTRARLTRFQAIYNFLVAQSELELLLGNAPIESYSAAIDSLN